MGGATSLSVYNKFKQTTESGEFCNMNNKRP